MTLIKLNKGQIYLRSNTVNEHWPTFGPVLHWHSIALGKSPLPFAVTFYSVVLYRRNLSTNRRWLTGNKRHHHLRLLSIVSVGFPFFFSLKFGLWVQGRSGFAMILQWIDNRIIPRFFKLWNSSWLIFIFIIWKYDFCCNYFELVIRNVTPQCIAAVGNR